MFLGCFEENDVPWVISVTQTLGLKWSHITTDNQRAHSKYLAASSAALISFGKLMYFYQQVPPATTSSPPSGPAYSWQDILPCLGATSKATFHWEHHLHGGCARTSKVVHSLSVSLWGLPCPQFSVARRLFFQWFAGVFVLFFFF